MCVPRLSGETTSLSAGFRGVKARPALTALPRPAWIRGLDPSRFVGLRRAICGGRCLRESREPALDVFLLLGARNGQILPQLVLSLIDSAAPQQYLCEKQSGIRELVLGLTQHFHGFERVALLGC